jgi:hypothetical protein
MGRDIDSCIEFGQPFSNFSGDIGNAINTVHPVVRL